LNLWGQRLQQLMLFGIPQTAQQLEAVWSELSTMPSLRTLQIFRLYKNRIPDLPILAHLERLLLIHYLQDMVPLMSQLTSITDLDLSWIYLSAKQLEQTLERNPAIRSNLRTLSLGFISSPDGGDRVQNFQALLTFICRNFSEIHSFDLLFAEHVSLCGFCDNALSS